LAGRSPGDGGETLAAVFKIGQENGTLIESWENPQGGGVSGIVGAPRVAQDGGTMWVTDSSRGLLAFDPSDVSTLLYKDDMPGSFVPVQLAHWADTGLSYVFGGRNEDYMESYAGATGERVWVSLEVGSSEYSCDFDLVNQFSPPIVDGDLVYYNCGERWYAADVRDGTWLNYADLSVTSSFAFSSLQLANGMVYASEGSSVRSKVVAFSTVPTTGAPSMSPTKAPTTDSPTTSAPVMSSPPTVAPSMAPATSGGSAFSLSATSSLAISAIMLIVLPMFY